jgi:hypothetical protein
MKFPSRLSGLQSCACTNTCSCACQLARSSLVLAGLLCVLQEPEQERNNVKYAYGIIAWKAQLSSPYECIT